MTEQTTPQPSPVDDYPERSYEEATSEAVTPTYEHVDQIADYHEKNPTLKANEGHSFPPPTQEDLDIPANPGAVVVEANVQAVGAPDHDVDLQTTNPLDAYTSTQENSTAPPVVDQADASGEVEVEVEGEGDTLPPVEEDDFSEDGTDPADENPYA